MPNTKSKSQTLTLATNAGPTQPSRDSQPGPKDENNVPILNKSIHKNYSLVPTFGESKSEEGRRKISLVGSI